MIDVLADENIPRMTIELLRESGMDVRSASEEMPGAVDTTVPNVARSEGRLLLTFDRDFGKLIYQRMGVRATIPAEPVVEIGAGATGSRSNAHSKM